MTSHVWLSLGVYQLVRRYRLRGKALYLTMYLPSEHALLSTSLHIDHTGLPSYNTLITEPWVRRTNELHLDYEWLCGKHLALSAMAGTPIPGEPSLPTNNLVTTDLDNTSTVRVNNNTACVENNGRSKSRGNGKASNPMAKIDLNHSLHAISRLCSLNELIHVYYLVV